MARTLKYLEGDPIKSIEEFSAEIEAGRYLIARQTKQRIHPGWAASWQFRMCLQAVRNRTLLRAIPNLDHPDSKKETK